MNHVMHVVDEGSRYTSFGTTYYARAYCECGWLGERTAGWADEATAKARESFYEHLESLKVA